LRIANPLAGSAWYAAEVLQQLEHSDRHGFHPREVVRFIKKLSGVGPAQAYSAAQHKAGPEYRMCRRSQRFAMDR
jgi:hypothetical protein